LGDDLDAPVDASAPMHWTQLVTNGGDPALPAGAEALSRFVKAPTTRPQAAQIGVVGREAGASLPHR